MVERFGRTSRRLHLLRRYLALSAFALVALVRVEPARAIAVEPGSVDKLLTVDCLLPGQVHRLGTQMTFLTARRAVKTREVSIRHG